MISRVALCAKSSKIRVFSVWTHSYDQVKFKNANSFQIQARLGVPQAWTSPNYIYYIVKMPLVEKLHIPCHFWNDLRVFTYSLHHLDITFYDLKTSKDLWHQVRINWNITEELWEDYCRTLGRLQIYKRKTNWRQKFGYWLSLGDYQRPLELTGRLWKNVLKHL